MNRTCTLLLILTVLPPALAAQDGGPGEVVSVTVRDGVTRGDELHAALRPADALEALRGVLAADSTRADALWRAAREAVNLGMLTDGDRAREWFEAAETWARRAIRWAPDDAQGYQWLAIALGRRALLEGPMTRVHLAEEVRATALEALARDSTAAGALNVLGQWHAEVRRLNGLARFTAERILGADAFALASWAEAERLLRSAVEVEPRALVHRVALARVLADRGRVDEARRQLEQALALPDAEPTDAGTREEARILLRELG